MWKLLLTLTLLGLAGGAAAQDTTAYKCVAADGTISFQDMPCPHRSRQQMLHLSAPAAKAPAPAATTPAPPRTPPPVRTARLPAVAPVELPQMYACIRATDGKHYISHHGRPQAYLAPSGMVAFPHSLAKAYGPGSATASAPELNRGRVTPSMIGSHYVWVQDDCRAMSVGEICAELRREHDANEVQIRKAFRSDRPPLEKRAAELKHLLRACGH